MDDAWWTGYEAGMTGEGTNPYPFGFRRVMWEAGQLFGRNALATILENCCLEPDDGGEAEKAGYEQVNPQVPNPI